MGSLPNLTAIGRSEDTLDTQKRHQCRSGSQCSGEEEFQLTHRPLRATRSAGSNKQYSVNQPIDMKLIKESAFSPLSTRSTCHHHHRHHPHIQHPLVTNISKTHHRDSMSTSGGSTIGTSSVKRLINVVRSTQPNIGPVYSSKKLCKNFTALCLGHAMITAALIPLYTLQSSLSIWGGSYAVGHTNFNIYDATPWSHEPPVYLINNQSIWQNPDRRESEVAYQFADEPRRAKRDIKHIRETKTERDSEQDTHSRENTAYPYWMQQYRTNETYFKVKYKTHNETDVNQETLRSSREDNGLLIEEKDVNNHERRVSASDKNQTQSDIKSKVITKLEAQLSQSNTTDVNSSPRTNVSHKTNGVESIEQLSQTHQLPHEQSTNKVKKSPPDGVKRGPVTMMKIVKRNQVSAKQMVERLPNQIHNHTEDEKEANSLSTDEDMYRTIHNVDNGSLLLALLFFVGAISTIYAPFYVQKFGIKSCFIQCYVIVCIFISSHYFPNVYILAVTYSMFGLFIGILSQAKIQFLVTLANKFSMVLSNANEDFLIAQFCILQQLLRLYILSQDIGVMLGGILTFVVLHANLNNYNIDYLFQYKDSGEKVCGSAYCPVIWSYLPELEEGHVDMSSDLSEILSGNPNETHIDRVNNFLTSISYSMLLSHVDMSSDLSEILSGNPNETHIDRVNNFLTSISYSMLPCKANSLLLSIYLGVTIISVILSIIFIDRIKNSFNFKTPGVKRLRICSIYSTYFRYVEMAVKDSKLQLTAPLSLFIGLEQGFMYSDFMKSYVSCVIGTVNIPMVLLSSSVLQSVAAFTLSMLLQHVKRLYSYVSCVIGTVNIPMVLLSSSVLQSVAAFTLSMLLQHVKRLYVMSKYASTTCETTLRYDMLLQQVKRLYVMSKYASTTGETTLRYDMLLQHVKRLYVMNVLFDLYPEYWQGPFAHSHFFRYLGLALSFGLHEGVCNGVKFYALTVTLLLSVAAFACLEVNIKHVKRNAFTPLPPLLASGHLM
ncbi:LOW QUALITY PROTEIN: uncharacterized protein LOC103514974 [Diaphorina citri]|uniref:LOW QUALITY PROTEIN: uncharacterized protein LOC103514974 n=1 Tax=Diaphorina citri TaxID=121845 RepID=A0A1S3DB30_DIACI|nr:LOW QUALITY PROTEIN: uncharacterized protein LOC103514974 [Diaphorina citri]